ncbi:MAG TPA: hypothetical protein VGG97_21475 [Bryobacteraceae bacterium]|jgi:hypothetical protein
MQQKIVRIKPFLSACAIGAALALTASAQSAVTSVTETPGNYSRDTTVTGANGKTATYQNNAAWANGAYTDNRSVTGFNGKTATYQNNRAWGNGSYSDTKSYTGFNGATRTDSVSRSGGLVSNTYTGRNGNSRTFVRSARFRR